LAEAGLEHPEDYPGKARLSTERDAKSDALSTDSPILTDRVLASLIAAWPSLDDKLKAEILQLATHLKAAR
jgi:hypothetical protein